MRKKVFWSVFLASAITMLITVTAIVGIIYSNSTRALKAEVRAEALYVSEALNVINEDNKIDEYIKEIGKNTENRITLIRADGKVLYDNEADPERMENHITRVEVEKALNTGKGDSTRHSDTIGNQNYYYAIKLDDGNIVRIANTTKSALGIIGNAAGLGLGLVIYILIVGIIIANILTKSFLKPLNNLDLDRPLRNDTYEELSPLLNSLEKKNKKIARQMDELTTKQEEFDYITSNMSEGLVIFDSHGSVLTANRSALEILNGGEAKSYLTLYRDISYIQIIEKALKGVSSSTKINLNGRIYRFSVSSVEKNDNGYAAVLFIVDITERENSDAMRREFSANVSHELKTPLTSILGYAELIKDGFAKTEDVPGFANKIYTESHRLLTLIEDIIKLSHLDEGTMKKEFEDTDLMDIGRQVVSKLDDKASRLGIDLSLEGKSAVIKGCKPVLFEMLFNICDNAITYNKENGKVTLTIKNEGDRAVVSVKDTGIGIAPEHQQRIFERFYRVDKSHSKETGGTGLGLSIVKHGAVLHNAKISLNSELGKGTEITIVFNK